MPFERRLLEGGFLAEVAGPDFALVIAAASAGAAATPRRGVLLTGAYGCGKTMAAELIYPGIKRVSVVDVRHISWLNAESDGSSEHPGMMDKAILLDDVGAERPGNDYGVRIEVVGDWLCRRHEQWVKGRAPLLAVTTNLNAEAIGERYGGRMLSRLLEMVVPVRMVGGDHRKRVTV